LDDSEAGGIPMSFEGNAAGKMKHAKTAGIAKGIPLWSGIPGG